MTKRKKQNRKPASTVQPVKKRSRPNEYDRRWEALVVQTRLTGMQPRRGIMNLE